MDTGQYSTVYLLFNGYTFTNLADEPLKNIEACKMWSELVNNLLCKQHRGHSGVTLLSPKLFTILKDLPS